MDYNKIEEKRKWLKMTQEELAEKARISVPGYKKMISKATMTVKNLEKISDVLAVPVTYWWEEEILTTQEPKVDYMKLLSTENRKLKEKAETDKRTIDRLHDQIDNMEGKIRKKASG